MADRTTNDTITPTTHDNVSTKKPTSTDKHEATIPSDKHEAMLPSYTPTDDGYGIEVAGGETSELRERQIDLEKQKAAEGNARFHRLGWKRLTIILIVEAIALGALSVPAAFAALGMVAGTICCVGIGLLAIYTSYVVGQVKLKYPFVSHYADAGRLLGGRWGYEIVGAMFVLQLTFLVGSHTLTGTIAFGNLTSDGTCSLVFGVVSAILLLLLAIPPSFTEMAILGYIDFISIIAAIGITIIATGIQHTSSSSSSLTTTTSASSEWSAWPPANLSFSSAFIAITNLVFAYSFAVCQFSFMDEMHTPADFTKSIWALGIIEIIIYTITGAVIYAFVGPDVASPALLSAGTTVSKVAFGVALPVIFISGAINTTTVARYIHGRIYAGHVNRFINTAGGWTSWLALISGITLIAWVIAEAIPFFSDLLSIMSSLFISGFSFYLPALFWFCLIKEGHWWERRNLPLAMLNAGCFLVGMVVLGAGTYASVKDIMDQYDLGTVRSPFTCAPIS